MCCADRLNPQPKGDSQTAARLLERLVRTLDAGATFLIIGPNEDLIPDRITAHLATLVSSPPTGAGWVFVVGGYAARAGAGKEIGTLMLGVYDDEKRLRYAGSVGTGWTSHQVVALLDELTALETAEMP